MNILIIAGACPAKFSEGFSIVPDRSSGHGDDVGLALANFFNAKDHDVFLVIAGDKRPDHLDGAVFCDLPNLKHVLIRKLNSYRPDHFDIIIYAVNAVEGRCGKIVQTPSGRKYLRIEPEAHPLALVRGTNYSGKIVLFRFGQKATLQQIKEQSADLLQEIKPTLMIACNTTHPNGDVIVWRKGHSAEEIPYSSVAAHLYHLLGCNETKKDNIIRFPKR